MREAYSIYAAKTYFSELVRKVKQGVEIIIKERGVPVGKLVPFPKQESFAQRIKGLAARGRIIQAQTSLVPKGIKTPGGLKRFLEERE